MKAGGERRPAEQLARVRDVAIAKRTKTDKLLDAPPQFSTQNGQVRDPRCTTVRFASHSKFLHSSS